MGGFEELMAQQARARDQVGAFDRINELVWAQVPDVRRSRLYDDDVSTPDYEQDFVSHGDEHYADNAMSHRGPEYWTEKEAFEDQWRIDQADRVGAECRGEAKRRAARKCEDGVLPNGQIDPRTAAAECMRLWADGMPDEISGSANTHEVRTGSSHELALEGEIGAAIPGGTLKGSGALRKTGGEETSATETRGRSMTRRGSEGYIRACTQMEDDWYMERLKAMQPYGE